MLLKNGRNLFKLLSPTRGTPAADCSGFAVTKLDDDVNQQTEAQTLPLLNEQETIERIFQHIDNRTTDLGDTVWQEPVAHYHSQERFDAELLLLRQ